MKTKDAQKKSPRNRPKPFVPDFMKTKTNAAKGLEVKERDEIKDILSRPRV